MEHIATEEDLSVMLEPLTRRNADGEAYQRSATVENQIQDALKLAPEELRRRLQETHEPSPDYVKEESLVYLIRHFRQAKDRQRVNELSECLLNRCAKWIYSKLRGLEADARDDGYSEVVQALFSRILDLTSDRGDFIQVRFWTVLQRLTVDAFRKQVNQQNLEWTGGYDQDRIDALTKQGAVMVPTVSAVRSVESEATDKILIEAALQQLEEPYRATFILRHYYGWPIENQNPDIQTISRHFGKTPRTIRNWLARADECLAAWRGEQL